MNKSELAKLVLRHMYIIGGNGDGFGRQYFEYFCLGRQHWGNAYNRPQFLGNILKHLDELASQVLKFSLKRLKREGVCHL